MIVAHQWCIMECTCPVTSTPTGTEVHMHGSQQEDSYQQIIPGFPRGSLYPTLSSLSSEAVPFQEEAQSLCNKVSTGLEKYLLNNAMLQKSITLMTTLDI